MSTPNPPRAPNFLTAVMTSLPSPEPRSTTKSDGPTAASASISSTTAMGVAANGATALVSSASATTLVHASIVAQHARAARLDVMLDVLMTMRGTV